MQPDETRRLIGARVRALRRERHLTQEQLAEMIDRTVDTISNIETGRLSTRIDTAVKLAAALGVTLSKLFDIGVGEGRDTEHEAAVAKLVQLVTPLDASSVEGLAAIAEQIVAFRQGG
jgi:transcriptional regulator with XRE-family HTH domain